MPRLFIERDLSECFGWLVFDEARVCYGYALTQWGARHIARRILRESQRQPVEVVLGEASFADSQAGAAQNGRSTNFRQERQTLPQDQITNSPIHESRSPDGDGRDPVVVSAPILLAARRALNPDEEMRVQQDSQGAGSEPADSLSTQIAAWIQEWVHAEWELREFSNLTIDEGRLVKGHAQDIAQHISPRLAAALIEPKETQS